ncbi:hypothetical protein LTR85_006064 [Meristemomyces frigidus]|nr:hypothetical protein LTR85_006064 [Meristemomyces frigidus]
MAFTPELPMDLPPSYFVYRDTLPGQPIDMAAPPTFFPPKDSDELFDALRLEYPHLKTHSERMRDAVIEFLLQERQAEQVQRTSPTTSFGTSPSFDPAQTSPAFGTATVSPAYDPATTSPWQSQSWPSMSSGSTSTFSSPETLGLDTPAFGMSPYPQAPQLSRQYSTAASTTPASAEMTPPALEKMTGVFSVCSSDQPKQRIRRKMTEAEKIEYRQRRIVKACDKCQKRKRKCIHNQPEVDNVTAQSHKQTVTATTHKITKPQRQSTATKPAVANAMLQDHNAFADLQGFNFDESFNNDMQLFDDFTNFFDEPVMQPDYDQYRQFDHMAGMGGDIGNRAHDGRGQLRWDDVQHDWSLPNVDQGNPGIIGHMQDTTGGRNLQTATSMNNANSNEATEAGQAQHERETGRQPPNGNGILWEHLRTGQPKGQPTHSPHGLEAEAFEAAGRYHSGTGLVRRSDNRHTDEWLLDSTVPATRRTQGEFGVNALSPRATSQGLPSTSVAQPSGSLFREESAARQGRPMMPTLGQSEGIARAASPSTELYMLKRRVPNALHTRPATDRLVKVETGRPHEFNIPRDALSTGRVSQANGGAYLRLDTDNFTRPEPLQVGSSSAGDKPAHTSSRNPTVSDQHVSSLADSPQIATAEQAGARADPHTKFGAHNAKLRHSPNAAAVGNQDGCVVQGLGGDAEVHELRLRDTFRRRDHFGRSLATATRAEAAAVERVESAGGARAELASVLVVLGGMLLLASLLPPANANFALLLLALASPVAGAKGTHFRDRAWRFWSQTWGTMLQCTIKNSSWLGLLQTSPEVAAESWPADDRWQHDGAWPGTSGEGQWRKFGVGVWGVSKGTRTLHGCAQHL